MKQCNHVNIVRLYEEYETKNEIYLIMELVRVCNDLQLYHCQLVVVMPTPFCCCLFCSSLFLYVFIVYLCTLERSNVRSFVRFLLCICVLYFLTFCCLIWRNKE